VTATDAHLAELSDDKRQVLETWLVEFDLSWDEGRLAFWIRRLPPEGDCLRRPALIEMVKIDLERRWQQGQRAKLEGYLKALPELGALDRLPADLLLAEYESRRQCGAPADLAEFARRFPRQADELRRLVEQTPDEAARATRQPGHESTRPGDHEADAGGSAWPALPVAQPAGRVTPDIPTPVSGWPARRPTPLPKRLGRYRIVRELGRGAMGTVYLAQDPQLDRLVAIKVPQFTATDGPEVRQRFLSEARAAATIEHPNVCPVYDVGEIDGIPYLTMAYLQGQPLARLLERPTPLPERQVAVLVRQLALALQSAHQRGIIHRDLKPSNIMINQRGEPVILDFGLARRLSQEARLTQSGQPLGTPAYMSPEQVAGAVRAMGPGCDIYALGVILYQLLTGRLPFEGPMAEVLGQIVTRQPEPPSKHRPDLDPRLEAICLKALSKGIADRHASMQDLGAALADYLLGDHPPAVLRIEPNPPGPGSSTPPAPLRRKPRWLGLAAAGAAAVILLASVLLWRTPSLGTIRIELAGPSAEVEVQVDGEPIEKASLDEPLRLPPGKHHLLVAGKKIQPVSTSFPVARGENPVLRVQLVPRADSAGDPARPGASKRRWRRHEDDDDHERRRDGERRERRRRHEDEREEPDDD
jgi:serine/threonine protein kinase